MGDETNGARRAVLDLRWWRVRDRRFWIVVAGWSVFTVGVGALLVVAVPANDETTGAIAALGFLAVVAAVAVVIVGRRVVVDADGIAIRYLRTRRWRWAQIVAVQHWVSDRGESSIVVIDVDGAATRVWMPADPALVRVTIDRFRPTGGPDLSRFGIDAHPTPSGESGPGAAVEDRPTRDGAPTTADRPLLVLASWWRCGALLGGGASIAVFNTLLIIDASWWGGGLAGSLFLGVLTVGLLAWGIGSLRGPPTYVVADRTAITVGARAGERTYPLSSVDAFTVVTDSWRNRSRLGAVIGDDVVAIQLPACVPERTNAPLVHRVVALSNADTEPEGSEVAEPELRPEDFDPTFRPAPLPPSALRWLVPLAFSAMALAAAAAAVGIVVAELQSAIEIDARGVETIATVVSESTGAGSPDALVVFDTLQGPVTVEQRVTPSQRDGDEPVALRYDPEWPETAWAPGVGPPRDIGRLLWPAAVFYLSMSAAAALWLRWHPPPWRLPASGIGPAR